MWLPVVILNIALPNHGGVAVRMQPIWTAIILIRPIQLPKTAGSLKIGTQHHEALNEDFSIFEPKDEYKGDFARAYMYMATCYGKDKNGNIDIVCKQYKGWRIDNNDVGSKFAMQNDNYLEFQPWEQEVIIQWHRQDPVSVKEIKRADAVSDFQHNRNPYIDYPYLAEYIWGKMAGKAVDMSHLVSSTDPRFIPGESDGWSDEPITAIDAVIVTPKATKIFRNGQVLILRDGHMYNIMGQEIK